MQQPNRNYTSKSYRYGFQGQEKDDELKGEGNSINYKYRMHDPRIGRFFAVDPLIRRFPHYSSYSFSGNKVIHAVELEGLEEYILNNNFRKSKKVDVSDGKNVFKVPMADEIKEADNDEKTYWFKWKSESRFAKKSLSEKYIHLVIDDIDYLKINSPMTIQGGDGNDGFEDLDNGNLFGQIEELVEKWKEDNWNIRGINHPKNLLRFKEASSSNGDFDFKVKLGLDTNTLYEINGTYYNANEAGNFYWGYAAAKLNIPLALMIVGGETYVFKRGRNFDEPWEVDAYMDGYYWYFSNWDKNTFDRIRTDGNNIDVYNYEKENTPDSLKKEDKN